MVEVGAQSATMKRYENKNTDPATYKLNQQKCMLIPKEQLNSSIKPYATNSILKSRCTSKTQALKSARFKLKERYKVMHSKVY